MHAEKGNREGDVLMQFDYAESLDTYVLCALLEANLYGALDDYNELDVLREVRLQLEKETHRKRDHTGLVPEIFLDVYLEKGLAWWFCAVCLCVGEALSSIDHYLFCRYTKWGGEIHRKIEEFVVRPPEHPDIRME